MFRSLSVQQRKILGSTAMFAVVCACWLGRFKPWGWWALGAVTASWLADGLLAKYPPVLGRVRGSFFVGASLFALAHACYGAASVMVLRAMGAPLKWVNFAVLMAVFLAAVACHGWLFARSSKRGAGFTVAATAYLLVVGAMAALAFRVGVESGGRLWMLPLGACLFFLSDCILVVREYRRIRSSRMDAAIWATYLSGQLLLQLGLWLA